jgi:hypothetical protein
MTCVISVFLAAFLCVPQAIALPLCVPSTPLLSSLSALGEVPVWRGLAVTTGSRRLLVVLLVHPTTHDWTLISTTPTRVSCVIAIGADAEMIAAANPARESNPDD